MYAMTAKFIVICVSEKILQISRSCYGKTQARHIRQQFMKMDRKKMSGLTVQTRLKQKFREIYFM